MVIIRREIEILCVSHPVKLALLSVSTGRASFSTHSQMMFELLVSNFVGR